jgi:uncharacterized protein (DUF1778 family)
MIPSVRIDLLSFPPFGSAGLVIRVRSNDRELINRAAAYIDMRQADFLRVVAVNAAREVIKQAELLGAMASAHKIE